MYIIVSYDVNAKRCQKVLKVLRKYLFTVLESVFEGEITDSKYVSLMTDLKEVIKENEDSVVVYKLVSNSVFKKDLVNVKPIENVI